MAKADWSETPEDLLRMIADRLFSNVELLRFRSVCRSWRSSAVGKVFPSPVDRHVRLTAFSLIYEIEGYSEPFEGAFLSRVVFFRISPSSSSPKHSRLIKLEELESGKKRILCPFSRLPIYHSCKNLDLLKFRVSAIHEAYEVKSLQMERIPYGFKKVVLAPIAGEARFLGIDSAGMFRYWNGELWTNINHNDNVNGLTDMRVHRGQIRAIDREGVVWGIGPSLRFIQCAPPLKTPWSHISFVLVDSCGELYVVERLLKMRIQRYGFKVLLRNSVAFKVYRLDEELGRLEEVKSLGDRAFVMAPDCPFSISARDFEGCIENSIYFTDEQEGEKLGNGLSGHDLCIFTLDDGGIKKVISSYHCFQMFFPSFLRM